MRRKYANMIFPSTLNAKWIVFFSRNNHHGKKRMKEWPVHFKNVIKMFVRRITFHDSFFDLIVCVSLFYFLSSRRDQSALRNDEIFTYLIHRIVYTKRVKCLSIFSLFFHCFTLRFLSSDRYHSCNDVEYKRD